MSRALRIAALVWVTFVSIFAFAAMGDTSAPHIAFHALALVLLIPAVVLARRSRRVARSRAQGIVATALCVSLPLAVLGHFLELAVAVRRLASDGWVNSDTSDVFEGGAHLWVSNLTIPAMLLSMVLAVVLVSVARKPG